MSDKRQELARRGEQAAAELLQHEGWCILERNFHYGKAGEIDIIARDGEYTVFVEVKTRSNGWYGAAEYSITPSKQRQILRIARGWMYIQGLGELLCRFDVMTVEFVRGEAVIHHIRNAFSSPG
ncbi:MAG: YraN family protein [Bacteroidetes bacterium]|nr:YraN family protein [Bacteroidota bacterium]